jgi:hypothetical protein
VKKPGEVMPQLPLPSKPIQAVRRTSRVPLKPQNSFRFAQKVPPGGVNGVPLEDELDEELLELEELLLEDELDELLDEEVLLEELLLDEELELLLELEELLLDEELELEELEELLPGSLTTVQLGAAKLPSWVPWKPKMWFEVLPGPGFCQPGQHSVNSKVVPGLVPPVRVAFHWLVIVTCSGKTTENIKASVSLTVPVLVTLMSTWNIVPPVLDGVTAQVCAAIA